jgi:hypothetical protein
VSLWAVAGLLLIVQLAGGAGCRRAEEETPPLATPSFSASRQRVPLGSPVDITYRFVVANNAPLPQEDLKVMVHFLDGDEEQLWTDDHDPPVPTSKWKAGQTIEYSRTVFIPIFPYVGPTSVHMGLYSTRDGRRFVLAGDTPGQRSYPVGALELVPRPEDAFIIYKDGWHNAEVARDNAAVEWQWTKRDATLSFRNPRRDATFYLHLDGRPDLTGEPVTVTLRTGDAVLDTFTVQDREEIVRKVPITAAQFGDGESVDLTLDVSKTFVPSLVPAAASNDSRELGVRVFHAYIEPK